MLSLCLGSLLSLLSCARTPYSFYSFVLLLWLYIYTTVDSQLAWWKTINGIKIKSYKLSCSMNDCKNKAEHCAQVVLPGMSSGWVFFVPSCATHASRDAAYQLKRSCSPIPCPCFYEKCPISIPISHSSSSSSSSSVSCPSPL